MDTIGKRLRHARETANERLGAKFQITQSELADQIGVTQGFIYKLETDANKRGSVDVTKLMKCAEYLKCSFLWLATGRGDVSNDDSHLLDDLNNQQGLPFIHPEQLDNPPTDHHEMMLNLTNSLASLISAQAYYTLVTDNGVNTRAGSGDLVLVDPGAEVRIGDFVLARVADKTLPIVRRIVERSGEQSGYTLRSLNEEFADRPLAKIGDLLGVVLEFRSFAREENSYKDRLTGGVGNVVRLVR